LAKSRLENIAELTFHEQQVFDSLTMPIEFAKDEVMEQSRLFQHGEAHHLRHGPSQPEFSPDPRSQLEETIWSCLVQRK
jgi:hypothetical protein